MDEGEEGEGEAGELMERDILFEGDDMVEGRSPEEGDQVAADGQEDEGDIDVEDEGGGTSDGIGDVEGLPGLGEVILEQEV